MDILESGIQDAANTLTITDHGFATGDQVVLTGAWQAISGLEEGGRYTVIVLDDNTIQLALAVEGSAAFAGTDIDAAADTITISGHGFANGDEVFLSGEGDDLGNLELGVIYRVQFVDADTIRLIDPDTNLVIDLAPSGFSGTLSRLVPADAPLAAIDIGSTGIAGTLSRTAQADPLTVELTFSGVNDLADSISVAHHGLLTGDEVAISENTAEITGLDPNRTYFAIKLNANAFRLADTRDDAFNQIAIDLEANDLVSAATFSLSTFEQDVIPPVINNIDIPAGNFSNRRDAGVLTDVVRGVVVTASNADNLAAISVSGGVSGVGGLQLAGSMGIHSATARAYIADGAQINQAPIAMGALQEVRVAAASDFFRLGVGGAGGVALAGAGAPGVDVTVLSNTTEAYIGAADVEAERDGTVLALAGEEILSIAAALSGTGLLGVAGSSTVVSIDNETTAAIRSGADVDAGGNVLVFAEDDTQTDMIAGTTAIGLLGGGAGASIAVTKIKKDTVAEIQPSANVTAMARTGPIGILEQANFEGVAVQADSSEDVFSVSAAGGGGLTGGLAGSANAEIIDSDTRATLGGQIQSFAGVDVTSRNDLKLQIITGAVSGGVVGGLSGAVDAAVLRNDTTAFITEGAMVTAALDVDVQAISEKTVDSVVVSGSLAGGLALSGTVAVYAIGGNLDGTYRIDRDGDDSDGELNENDDSDDALSPGDQSLSSFLDGQLAEFFGGDDNGFGSLFGTVDPASETRVNAALGASLVSDDLESQTEVTAGTSAFIGRNASVSAGGDIDVSASDDVDVEMIAGGVSFALKIGLGTAVAIMTTDNNVEAFIGRGASVSAGGDIRVQANLDQDIDAASFTGAVSLGGALGAAVVRIRDDSDTRAYIEDATAPGNGAAITSADLLEIEAISDLDLDLFTAEGGAAIGVAAGAAVVEVLAGGETRAYVGDFARIGETGVVNDLHVESQTIVDVGSLGDRPMVIGVGAGVLGGAAGIAFLEVDGLVEASIGEQAYVEVLGQASVHAGSDITLEAAAVGGALGGIVVGAMVANLRISGATRSRVERGATILANAFEITAAGDHNAETETIAASGGVLFAGNFNRAQARSNRDVIAEVLTSSLTPTEITTSDDVLVASTSAGDVNAVAFGVSVGLGLQLGLSRAEATFSPEVKAILGGNVAAGGAIQVNASHQPRSTTRADAHASGGGTISGNGSKAEVDAKAELESLVSAGSTLSAGTSISVNAASVNRADALADGVTVGLLAGFGGTDVDADASGTTIAGLENDVTITSAQNLSIEALNTDLAEAESEASGGGVISVFDPDETRATVNSHVDAMIGGGSDIQVSSTLTLRAEGDTDADALARGTTVGGIDVSRVDAEATARPDVTASIGVGAEIIVGGTVTIEARHNESFERTDGSFIPRDSGVVNLNQDTIQFQEQHGLAGPITVEYSNGGNTSIGGLQAVEDFESNGTSLDGFAPAGVAPGFEVRLFNEDGTLRGSGLVQPDLTWSISGISPLLTTGETIELQYFDNSGDQKATQTRTLGLVGERRYTAFPFVHADGTQSDRIVQLGAIFDSNQVDFVSDLIRFDQDHHLQTGDELIYRPLPGSTAIGGLTPGETYLVRVIDETTIKLLESADDLGDAPAIDVSGIDGTNGIIPQPSTPVPFQTLNVMDMENAIEIMGHGFSTGDHVAYTTADVEIGGLQRGKNYVVIVVDPNTIRLAETSSPVTPIDLAQPLVGLPTDSHRLTPIVLEAGDAVTYRAPETTAFSEANVDAETDTIVLSNHGLAHGETVEYRAEGTPISGLEDGRLYKIAAIDERSFQLENAGDVHQLETADGMLLNFDTGNVDRFGDSILLSPLHGLSRGDVVTYHASGISLGGLVPDRSYVVTDVVAKADMRGDRIRLAEGPQPIVLTSVPTAAHSLTFVDSLGAAVTLTFANTDVDLAANQIDVETAIGAGHGLVTLDQVVYNSSGLPLGGLENGRTYRVIKVDDNTLQLAEFDAIDLTSPDAGQNAVEHFLQFTDADGMAKTLEFANADLNPQADVISLADLMGLQDGDEVVYRTAGNPIVGLSDGETYVAIVSAMSIQLAERETPITAIDLDRPGGGRSDRYQLTSPMGLPVEFVLADLDDAQDAIRIASHSFATGDEVVFEIPEPEDDQASAEPIGGLVAGRTYLVVVVDANTIRLSESSTDLTAAAIDLGPTSHQLTFTQMGQDVVLNFDSANVSGFSNAIQFESPHGLSAGDLVFYTADGNPLAGLTPDEEYAVVLFQDSDTIIQLADPADPDNPLDIDRPPAPGEVHEFRSPGHRPIGGLNDGQTYFVSFAPLLDANGDPIPNTTDTSRIQLSETPGGPPISPLDTTAVLGVHTLGIEGIDLTSPGSGPQTLVFDLTSKPGGTHRLLGLSGASSLIDAPSGDGVVTASAQGSSGSLLFGKKSSEARSDADPEVRALVESGARVRAGGDVMIASRSDASGAALARNRSGSVLVSLGGAEAELDIDNISQAGLKTGAVIEAAGNLTIFADSSQDARVDSNAGGGGLVDDQGSKADADVQFTTEALVGLNASISGTEVDIFSQSALNGDADTDSVAKGFVGLADGRARVVAAFNQTVTRIEGMVTGDVVRLHAENRRTRIDANAVANAKSVGGDTDADAIIELNHQAVVQLGGRSEVTGFVNVELLALHSDIRTGTKADAETEGVGDADALSLNNQITDSRINGFDESLIVTSDLLVEAISNPNRYDRDARAKVFKIKLGPFGSIKLGDEDEDRRGAFAPH